MLKLKHFGGKKHNKKIKKPSHACFSSTFVTSKAH